MTPAILVAKKQKISYIVHEYSHDSASQSYGLEAAQKLNVAHQQIFKTLVVSLDEKQLAVAIVPVVMKLNMKSLAKAAGAKKAVMAAPVEVERATGYVLGGVSPLGQKKRLKTFIDSSAQDYATIYVSAGRRGLDIELNPTDLKALVQGTFCQLAL